MNKFAKKYKYERKNGRNEYEAFGIVANYIAVVGTFNDLQEVYDVHMDDFKDETEGRLDEAGSLTSYEKFMRLSGHKESDFE